MAGAFIATMPLATEPESFVAVLGFGDLAVDWAARRLLLMAFGAGTACAFAGYRGLGWGNGLAAGALGILTLLATFFLGFITRFCCAATRACCWAWVLMLLQTVSLMSFHRAS